MKKCILLLLFPFALGCSGSTEQAEIELMGKAYAERNYGAVLRHFSRIDPEHHLHLPLEIHKMAGIASFYTGNTEGAERILTAYLEINGEDGEAHFYLGLMKGSRGEEYCHHIQAAIERRFKPDIQEMFSMNVPPCEGIASK